MAMNSSSGVTIGKFVPLSRTAAMPAVTLLQQGHRREDT
jgi:hypothetical protein